MCCYFSLAECLQSCCERHSANTELTPDWEVLEWPQTHFLFNVPSSGVQRELCQEKGRKLWDLGDWVWSLVREDQDDDNIFKVSFGQEQSAKCCFWTIFLQPSKPNNFSTTSFFLIDTEIRDLTHFFPLNITLVCGWRIRGRFRANITLPDLSLISRHPPNERNQESFLLQSHSDSCHWHILGNVQSASLQALLLFRQ